MSSLAATLLDSFPLAQTPEARQALARAYTRAKLREGILACTRCPLHTTSLQRVPWSGGPAPIAMVGEGPGFYEDRAGVPFVGPAGQLLDRILAKVGLSRDSITLLNLLCCRPPSTPNKSNDFDEAIALGAPAFCAPWFRQQLDVSGAWVVVLLGARALKQVLGDPNAGITKHRGKMFWKDGRLYLPTFHPAYALRSPEAMPVMVKDLEFLPRLLENDRVPIPNEFPRWLMERWLGHPLSYQDWALHTKTLLTGRGYLLVFSTLLNAQVVVVRDETIVPPPSIELLPRYTLAELASMRALVDEGTFHFEDLRRCHLVKQELGGRVVL